MKAFDQFFVAAGFAAFLPFCSFSQPCLVINAEPQSNCGLIDELTSFSSTLNAVQFHLGERDFDLMPSPPPDLLSYTTTTPRYKVFWMPGDGNFIHSSFDNWESDLATHHQPYSYSVNDTYLAKAVLVEKKSNTSPPREPTRRITVPPSTVAASPFNQRILGTNTLDIFNHERNRPDYPTVFVLSAPRADIDIDSIFFFFNCKHDLTAGTYSPMVMHPTAAIHFIDYPNYFTPPAALPPIRLLSDLPAYFSPILPVLQARFQHFISIPMRGKLDSKKSNPFPEWRVFPALKSIYDLAWAQSLPLGHYLALSTGFEPATVHVSELTDQYRSYFSGLPAVPPLILASPAGGQSRHVHGISSTDIQMVASIDPNGLTVEQICPIGPNEYRVDIRMEVCNEGYLAQSGITFTLEDQAMLFTAPEFETTAGLSLVSTLSHLWTYSWGVMLDGVHFPGDPVPTTPPETCAVVKFSTTTNWLGVQKITQGQGLKLCVTFSYGAPLCHFNTSLDETEVTPTTGYKCGDPASATDCGQYFCLTFCLAAFGILVAILLLLWIIWLLYKRKFVQ